jgi:hypothetical protein
VNVLLDEQLDAAVAAGLNAMSHRHGMWVRSIRDFAAGTKDEAIPDLCRIIADDPGRPDRRSGPIEWETEERGVKVDNIPPALRDGLIPNLLCTGPDRSRIIS